MGIKQSDIPGNAKIVIALASLRVGNNGILIAVSPVTIQLILLGISARTGYYPDIGAAIVL